MTLTNDYEKYVKEIYKKFDKFQIIEEENKEFNRHFKLWNYFDYGDYYGTILDGQIQKKFISLNTPGKVFLYEKLIIESYSGTNQKLYYPKVGIYLNSPTL